jgi:formate-dependent nitrite reductase membrane component NrfD
MKPYEWMVTYTPQTDWIKGGGAIVWLSFFTGIFGSGAYLASLYFNNLTGMIISWLIIAVLKSGLHVGHAKHPFRLWRMALKFRTSWIARGTVFTALVGLFGAVQIILTIQSPGTTPELVFKVLTALAAFAVMIYEGFTINYISGIPFWNSSLLPATLISWGLLTGLALLSLFTPEALIASRAVLIITIVLTLLYLWNAIYAGATSKESAREVVKGVLFWIGAVLIGFAIPLFILFGPMNPILFLICAIIGGLAFTYSVFKAGVYRPLV